LSFSFCVRNLHFFSRDNNVSINPPSSFLWLLASIKVPNVFFSSSSLFSCFAFLNTSPLFCSGAQTLFHSDFYPIFSHALHSTCRVFFSFSLSFSFSAFMAKFAPTHCSVIE